jgi:hypothetical protein
LSLGKIVKGKVSFIVKAIKHGVMIRANAQKSIPRSRDARK